jgi:predicted DNA-binding transcriptional regulator YafY
MDNLITWIMTFGDKAEVLEPKKARKKIALMVQKMTTIYKEDAAL